MRRDLTGIGGTSNSYRTGAADAKTRGPRSGPDASVVRSGLSPVSVPLPRFASNHGGERVVNVCQDGDSNPRNSCECVQVYFFPRPLPN